MFLMKNASACVAKVLADVVTASDIKARFLR